MSELNLPPLAVLVSGGLDSAILVGDTLTTRPVQPIYVRVGSFWESVELNHLRRYLASLETTSGTRLLPLIVLDQPVADLYGSHWSMTGSDVPGADTPDEAVFLPGRNLLLLAKPLLWCHLNGVSELALAPLETNPFPDATADFFRNMANVVNQAICGTVRILTPYAGLHKSEVLRRGRELPLQHTFSCIRPTNELHCGRCNKCAERRAGFAEAGLADPTLYANPEPICSA